MSERMSEDGSIINLCDRVGQKQAAEVWKPNRETDKELPKALDVGGGGKVKAGALLFGHRWSVINSS